MGDAGVRRAAVMLGMLALGACARDWRERVVAGAANPEPTQAVIADASRAALPGHPGVQYVRRARYENRAWAVAVDRAMRDDWREVAPVDVALAWGPVARPEVLRHMKFHLAKRYVSVRWTRDVGLDERQVMRHLSNHHLVPADERVAEDLDLVRPGDLVHLYGDLVDLYGPSGRMGTSLSRDDKGNGACEVVRVQRVVVARPQR